ncbi:MAG: DHA2 family efflux MFS transporter permease subunit [Verrucomicrobia bacterium]|nr:DHA2 family efflux MFS transporter permease subunit [Verrucomicrobiota bacterium]
MNGSKHLTGMPLFLATVAIALATFLIVLDYTIANVSIPYIAGDLGISVNEGTYVITSFAVGSAIILPITGRLTQRIGLIKLTIISLLGFIFFSWACGVSPNLISLVVARFFQGVTAGPLIPLSQTLIVSIYPPEKKNQAIAYWGSVVIVAPVLGPILGGWISYDFYWPWIFYINIPFGLFSAFIIHLLLRPYETPTEQPRSDIVGFILLTIGVSTLQFSLDKGEQYDWLHSPLILSCLIISLISFVYLVIWELFHPSPLLDLRLLKIPSFNLSCIYISTVYAIYFGGVVLVPLWLQKNMGYTAIWAGIAVAPLGLASLVFSGFMGKLINRIGSIIPIGISLIFFALSSFYGAYFNTEVDIYRVAFSRLLFGCGLLFFTVPLFSLAVRDIPLEKLPSSTGMFHFFRAMMGGVGTSIFTTLWTRRNEFHHANLVAEVIPSRNVVAQYYTKLESLGIVGEKAQAFIDYQANNQAAMLGINDCFYLMGWIFLLLMGLLLLGRSKKGSVQQTQGAHFAGE